MNNNSTIVVQRSLASSTIVVWQFPVEIVMELHKLKSTDSFINDRYAIVMQYAAC